MSRVPDLQAILDHQDFVLRLARGLVADPAAADDLAQDTWLSYLQHPPRAAAAVRSWLGRVVHNRARNRSREDRRRALRELAAAKPEAQPRDDAQERLELQQRVVAAVLALAEPQRRTLLLHYFDGLPVAAIAARTGAPAGTVRSRLCRALAELRARLDADHGERRSGWLPGLLAMLEGSRRAALRGWWLAGTAAAGVATIGFALARGPEPGPSPGHGAIAALPHPGAGDPAVLPAEGALGAGARPPSGRVAVRPPVQDPALAEMAMGDLERTAAWIQHLLRRRLLVADPDIVGSELAALAGHDGVGATRLLRREWAEIASTNALGIGGGGAYFSFASRSHHYGDRPDLSLEAGHYGTGFHGGMVGALLPLGDLPLAAVGPELPTTLGGEQAAAWDYMWRPALDQGGRLDPEWFPNAHQLGLHGRCPALPDRTYLLHRAGSGEHDLLVAFRTVATDAHGHTIVYRVLRAFTAPDLPRSSMPEAPPGEPPAWLRGRDVEDLLRLLRELRAVAEPRLLAVPDAVLTAFAPLIAQEGCGASRILARGRFDAVVAAREGAAYVDFVARTHAYGDGVHLGLDGGRFGTGFAGGDAGFVLDLGPVPLAAAERPNPGQDDRMRQALALVRDLEPVQEADGGLRIDARDAELARQLGVEAWTAAKAGHTYLLRAVHSDHTIAVAFTVVGLDAGGATLVWRILSRSGR